MGQYVEASGDQIVDHYDTSVNWTESHNTKIPDDLDSIVQDDEMPAVDSNVQDVPISTKNETHVATEFEAIESSSFQQIGATDSASYFIIKW